MKSGTTATARWVIALLLILLTGGILIRQARLSRDSSSALVDGKTAAASEQGNQPGNEARLQPVFLGVDVGNGPDDDSPGPEHRRDLTGIPAYTEENLDPVIPLSMVASDYDDFCRAEFQNFRAYYVFEPATGLNYLCVANRDGRWVAVPGKPGVTSENLSAPLISGYSRFSNRVVGKTRLTGELKHGERRKVFLER